jgi:hypothetical protein
VRVFLKLLFLALVIGFSAKLVSGQSLSLLLVPKRTSFAPGEQCAFDIYFLNQTGRALKVPSLAAYEAVYTVWRPGAAEQLPRVSGTGPIYSHDLASQVMKSNALKHSTTTMSLKVDAGELVEVYIEVGEKSRIRSNVVLLRCITSEERTVSEHKNR